MTLARCRRPAPRPRRHPGRRRFPRMPREPAGGGRRQGRVRADLRRRDGEPPARHDHLRADEQSAGVQDADLGLRRDARRRGARGRRALRHAPARAGARRGGEPLRGRPPHHRRRLGRRVEFRQGHRRPPADPVARHAVLRAEPPLGLLSRRADGDAEDRRGRRDRRLAPEGLLGRRVRAHPVHALHLPAPRGGRRRRRAAGRGRFGAGRRRLHRQLPAQGGLELRAALGLRGAAARRASTAGAAGARTSARSRPGPPWA